MHQTTEDHQYQIEWNLSGQKTSTLPNDFTVMSSTCAHLQARFDQLTNYAKQMGLHINSKKMKPMDINAPSVDTVSIKGETLECVEGFTCLGKFICNENSAPKKSSRPI